MQYTYETVGNSSYLVAKFPGGEGIVNYQLQMLVNNDIKNIIKANKSQKNDDVMISYNITAKIPLAQIDIKNKIPKRGLINIIEGALGALEDIEEYQLTSSGIVFDEEYIFVKPGSYEPSFIYVPNSTEDCGIEPLKKFILSLIMKSKVEMANDNFVQTLLDTLNKVGLTGEDLRKLCLEYKTGKSVGERKEVKLPSATDTSAAKSYAGEQGAVLQKNVGNEACVAQGAQTAEKPVMPQNTTPPVAKTVTTEKVVTKENEKSSLQKIIFLILQLVLVGAVAAIYMMGFLTNEDGSFNSTYLLGIAIALGGVDFVLYRELFVNSKSKDEDKKKQGKKREHGENTNTSAHIKTAPSRAAIPGKEISSAPTRNIPRDTVKKEMPVTEQPVQTQTQIPVTHSIPQPAFATSVPTRQYGQISDFESEDTVVLDAGNTVDAYLEYFENGLSTKIKLTKEQFIVGKLRGQCDFAINNNKISKIHAEFITRGGEYFVKDYNSTNGTYINGSNQRIASNSEYQIFNGDRITLANLDMTFRC